VTQILEHEALFQGKKARILFKLQKVSEQITDPSQIAKVFDYITRMMASRPDFDFAK